MNKITEKTAAASVKGGASFLITQQETVNGAETEALRRAGRNLVEKALVEPKFLGLYNAIFGSGGEFLQPKDYAITGSAKWGLYPATHVCVPCKAGDKIVIIANTAQKTYYAFLASDAYANGQTPEFAPEESGRYELVAGGMSEELTAPEGCNFLYLHHTSQDGTAYFYPQSIKINGVEQNESAAQAHEQITRNALQLARCAELTTEMVTAWKAGSMGTTNGTPVSSGKVIYTPMFYLIHEDAEIAFAGDASTGRFHAAYFYDAEKRFISPRKTSTPYAVPAGARYVRFVYGFMGSVEDTVESYGGVDAVAADWAISYVSPAEKKRRLHDDLMAQAGIIPYWANGYKAVSETQMRQENSLITINGINNSTTFRMALSGTFNWGVTDAAITGATDTIRLKAGHTYKLKIEYVSGNYAEDEDGTFRVDVGIFQGSSITALMSKPALVDNVEEDWKTFTPNATGLYKIGMVASRKVDFLNFTVRVVLTDITEWVSA